jgi:hypothetical protein
MKVLVLALTIFWAVYLGVCGLVYHTPEMVSGYNAKKMCSEIFVAKRSEYQVRKHDLVCGCLTETKVDLDNKTAIASFGGLITKTAIYRPGLGCTLLQNLNAETLRKSGRKSRLRLSL